MGDHGIVSGYRRDADGWIEPVLLSSGNDAAEAWGLRLYRLTLYAFCAALVMDHASPDADMRPLVHQVMERFSPFVRLILASDLTEAGPGIILSVK